MPTYRVRVIETVTVEREYLVTASDEVDAVNQAENGDTLDERTIETHAMGEVVSRDVPFGLSDVYPGETWNH